MAIHVEFHCQYVGLHEGKSVIILFIRYRVDGHGNASRDHPPTDSCFHKIRDLQRAHVSCETIVLKI